MSKRIRSWLPPGAAMGPRVRHALEETVAAWSETWFAGTRAGVQSVEPRTAGAVNISGGWFLFHGAVALPADGSEAIRLAALALGVETEGIVLSEADRDILGRLAATMLADLASALTNSLGLPLGDEAAPLHCVDPLDSGSGLSLVIADTRHRFLCQVAIPSPSVVPMLKAGIARRPAPALARFEGPLGRSRARLDISLGEAKLSLGELAGLAVGDVLVLDRKIAAGATVAVRAGRRDGFARASFDSDGGRDRLVLAAEPGKA